jgi:anti-anti-sigma regulatory factor
MPAGTMPFVLNLGATLNVDKAAALRNEIAAAFASGNSVNISFSSVEELDLPCLQVLYAALLSAKASGKELHFVGTLTQRISGRLKSSGFLGDARGQAADLEASLVLLS